MLTTHVLLVCTHPCQSCTVQSISQSFSQPVSQAGSHVFCQVPVRVVKVCVDGVERLLLFRANSHTRFPPVPEPEGLLITAQAACIGPHIHCGHDCAITTECHLGHMGLQWDAIDTPLQGMVLLSQADRVPGSHLHTVSSIQVARGFEGCVPFAALRRTQTYGCCGNACDMNCMCKLSSMARQQCSVCKQTYVLHDICVTNLHICQFLSEML